MYKNKLLKWSSYASAAGMFLILMMGALVTKTESGRGCGDDWPLCNGQFVPAYTIESIIEWSHRFVTGVVGLILLACFIFVFRYSRRNDAKFFVSGAMFFTVVQAIMGALAVKWPQSSSVLALHFGFSLFAFAFTLLLAFVYSSLGSQWMPVRKEAGASRGDQVVKLSPGFRLSVWLTGIYCYIVVYIGAYVRHTESAGGCSGWPLCNGEIVPPLEGATGIVFIHRVAAFLLLVLIILLNASADKSYKALRPVHYAARAALVLVVLQVISGGVVTFMMGAEWYLIASLAHTVLISCLFGVLSYLCVLVTQASLAERKGEVYGIQQSPRIS